MPKTKAKKQKVPYPEPKTELFIGDKALSCAEVKEILGWTELADDDDNYLFISGEGKRIRLKRNLSNRPFRPETMARIKQDILNKHWEFNGENIIISEYGNCLSLQHRGSGFVEACGEWAKDEHWRENWPEEPTLETSAIFGIKETPEVIRTIDDVATRTDADVLYTMSFFKSNTPGERNHLTKVLARAIRVLWDRTGAKERPYDDILSHSELVQFVDNHPKLTQAVLHVWEENSSSKNKNGISRKLGLGDAAAFLYLMGCCESSGEAYRSAEPPSEKLLKWTKWTKACNFWTAIASDSAGMKPLREARYPQDGDPKAGPWTGVVFGKRGASLAEKKAIIVLAWNVYHDTEEAALLTGKWLHSSQLRLDYTILTDSAGKVAGYDLDTIVTLGGVDKLPSTADVTPDDEDTDPTPPTPEEIKAEKERIKQAKEEEKSKLAELASLSLADQLEQLRLMYPGKILLFKRAGSYSAFGDDAHHIAKVLKLPSVKHEGELYRTDFAADKLDDSLARLKAAGFAACALEIKGKEVVPTKKVPPKPKTKVPEPVANGKPTAKKPAPAPKTKAPTPKPKAKSKK